ncbi:hypothetical protein COCVIDRAFT_83574, partial [Bipolaris victoriae FI3]
TSPRLVARLLHLPTSATDADAQAPPSCPPPRSHYRLLAPCPVPVPLTNGHR